MLHTTGTRNLGAYAPRTSPAHVCLARPAPRTAVTFWLPDTAVRRVAPIISCVETTAAETAVTAEEATSPTGASSSKPRVPAPAPNVLFARNLAPRRAKPPVDEFEALVRQNQGVQDVCLTRKGNGGYLFGYITFDTEENAQAAKEKLHDTDFNGLRMQVSVHERAKPLKTAATADATSRKQTRNRRQGPPVDAFDIRAGNLAWTTTDAELKEHFKDCEGLQDAFIVLNRQGKPSGHGYVRFETDEQAAEAVKDLQGSMLDGREIQLRKMPPGRIDSPQDEQVAADSSSANADSGATADSEGSQQQQQQVASGRKVRSSAAFSVRAGNLAWATTDNDLQEHFKECPGVRDAFVVMNKQGRPAGAGYVVFDTEEQAVAAVEALQGSLLAGREIKLKKGRAGRVDTPQEQQGDQQGPLTQTRIVVKNIPPSYGWREVFGMCSVFGEVKRALILTRTKNRRSQEAAERGADSAGASDGDEVQSADDNEIIRAALAVMADRAAAEKVLEGLNGLQVQGKTLQVNVYRGTREKAQKAAVDKGSTAIAAEGISTEAAAAGDE